MFHWRLAYKDGPQYCDFDTSRDNLGWVNGFLPWPRYSTLASFQKEFVSANMPRVRTALRESVQRKRPVCFSTLIGVSEIENDFRAFVDAWIQSWPELLEQTFGAVRTERPSSPQPIVGLLVLMFESAKTRFWRFWESGDARLAQYSRELKNLESSVPRSSGSAAIEVSSLPPSAPSRSRMLANGSPRRTF
jgi:hypothetical protein